MKLCLLIVAAVAVATCYALPVPKEEVFTVYPVNSGTAPSATELPTVAQAPDQKESAPVEAPKAKDDDDDSGEEDSDEGPDFVERMEVFVGEPMVVTEISEPKVVSGVVEAMPVGGVIEPKTGATMAPKSAEGTEAPKEAVPVVKAAAEEKETATPKPAAAEPSEVERKQDSGEDRKAGEVKPEATQAPEAAGNKLEKLTEQPKVEAAQAPVEPEKLEAEVKSEAAVEKAEAPKPMDEASSEVPPVKSADLQPQTEGKAEGKPAKVRAAPIVEGLKAVQPVEAEPAVTKIHVTVIQEEIPLRPESAAPKEPVAAEGEGKRLEPASVSAGKGEPRVQARPDVEGPTEGAVQTEDASGKPVEAAPKSVAVPKRVDEPKQEPEPSAKASLVAEPTVATAVVNAEVTTVAAVAVTSAKPEEVATVPAVPATESKTSEEASKAPEPLAKAAEGSSQPAGATTTTTTTTTTESAVTVQADSKDSGDGDSTTVTATPQADSTTLAAVTEPEPVPTPAKQKAKKQAPLDLKGYRQRLKQLEAQTKKSVSNE